MSDNGDVQFENDEEVRRELDQIENRIPRAMEAGLQAVGFQIIGDAKKMAPVDTGFLMNSAYVTDATILRGTATIEIGFGAEYAPYVHEATDEKLRGKPRPDPRKGNFWDGGESEYLLKAIEQNDDAGELFQDVFFESLRSFGGGSSRPSDIPETPENTGTPSD